MTGRETGGRARGLALAAVAILAIQPAAAAGSSTATKEIPPRPAAAGPSREAAPPPPEALAREALPGYTLGDETIPGGDFEHVGPHWRQMRPDEGERLTIVPDGWEVGYQGGERKTPIPGKDPETGSRCMDFLYGSGRMDLVTPEILLDEPGAYLLSMRTRSVVGPTHRALRAVVEITVAADPDGEKSSRVIERWFPAGPEERRWHTWATVLTVPPGAASAVLHLIKDDAGADFLVDDVSFRRVEAAPSDVRIPVPAGGPWTSPVVYLGSVETAAAALEGGGSILRLRAGASAEPGPSWTGWRRPAETGGEAEPLPLPLSLRGIPLYMQAEAAADEGAPERSRLVVHTQPWTGPELSPAIELTGVPSPPEGDLEGWKRLTMAKPLRCTGGRLAPVRELALRATTGIEGDLPRARAIASAVRAWAPLDAGGKPPASAPSPGPGPLLADCGRATPLYCGRWRQDLAVAACGCTGLVCRAVSSHEAGDLSASVEGIEVWSDDLGKWVFVPSEGTTLRPPGEPEGSGDLSAAEIAARRGVAVAIAMDLRWGERGWVTLQPPRAGGEDVPDAASVEFPVDFVRCGLEAAGPTTLAVTLDHGVPGFLRYEVRSSPRTSWRTGGDRVLWKLVAGRNEIEIRAVNALGEASGSCRLRASLRIDPADRAAPYAGLRPLGGDPHVHTGLAIYSILDPSSPQGTGDVAEVFATARKNGLQWAAVTDYAHNIDDPRSVEMRRREKRPLTNPDGSRTESEWDHERAVVDAENRPGEFAAFLGLEYDGGGLTSRGGTGRKIVLLPGTGAETHCSPSVSNTGDCPVVEDAFRYTRRNGGVMIAVTPCRAPGAQDTDWSRWDPVVSLMDLYGGACEEGPGGFVDVTTRRGLLVGAAGGGGSWSATAGLHDRTICWATAIRRDAILEAIRARRCYWSAAGHLDLAFSVNGAPMGAVVAPGDRTAWSAEATGVSSPAFARIEILRDGMTMDEAPCATVTQCFIEGGLGEPAEGAYYAAVSDAEGHRLAISSPVYVRAPAAPPAGAGPSRSAPGEP